MRRQFKVILLVFILYSVDLPAQDTNLLDISTWTIGEGSVPGFNNNGLNSENSREYGKNHIGEEVILWKASPSGNSSGDGGWNTNSISIDHDKSYQFSVWIKKVNSHDGKTYFGCKGGSSGYIVEINGDPFFTGGTQPETVNNNPYFWYGDLPQLDRWYLLVGYVLKSSYTPSTSNGGTAYHFHQGGIYDGVTGEKVVNMKDYKFSTSATSVRHRAYLYYDSNTSDRQFFYFPRIDEINGEEPTVNELLGINENYKLFFSYDNAGNQTKRIYKFDNDRLLTAAPKPFAEENEIKNNTIKEKENFTNNKLRLHPNPTNGMFTITTTGKNYYIKSISIYNSSGALVYQQSPKGKTNQINIDISYKATGIYYINTLFSDNTTKTEKIIKK